MKNGKIVTVDLNNSTSSNTYVIHRVLEDTCLLKHPLFPECLIEYKKLDLDKVSPVIKDSTERCLDFAIFNKNYLDYNMIGDLEALCLYFVIRRKLTPQQKRVLSGICGMVASIHFNNSIEKAMRYIVDNEAALDDFNRMWYNNFQGLFKKNQPITSKKQRSAIFNIAGFILAELECPKTSVI